MANSIPTMIQSRPGHGEEVGKVRRRIAAVLLLSMLSFLLMTSALSAAGEGAAGQPTSDAWQGEPLAPGHWRLFGRYELRRVPDGERRWIPRGDETELRFTFTGTGANLHIELDGQLTRYTVSLDGEVVGVYGFVGHGPNWLPAVQGLPAGRHTVTVRPVAGGRLPPLAGVTIYDIPPPTTGTAVDAEGQAAVTWLPGTAGAGRYRVYRSSDGAAPQWVGTVAGTTFIDPDAPRGSEVTYLVQAEGPRGVLSPPVPVGTLAVPRSQQGIRLTGLRGAVVIERAASGTGRVPGVRLAAAAGVGPVADTGGLRGVLPMHLAAAGDGPGAAPATLGMEVLPGDRLLVQPGGWAELTFDRDQAVRLDEGTDLVIDRHDIDPGTGRQNTGLRVLLGRLWVSLVDKLSPDSRFEVETPTIVAGVRGTSFVVDAGDQSVAALSGTVYARPAAPPAVDDAPAVIETALAPGEMAVTGLDVALQHRAWQPEELSPFAQAEALKHADRLPPGLRSDLEQAVPPGIRARVEEELEHERGQRQQIQVEQQRRLQDHLQGRLIDLLESLPPTERPGGPPADRPGGPPAGVPGGPPADRPGGPPADRGNSDMEKPVGLPGGPPAGVPGGPPADKGNSGDDKAGGGPPADVPGGPAADRPGDPPAGLPGGPPVDKGNSDDDKAGGPPADVPGGPPIDLPFGPGR